ALLFFFFQAEDGIRVFHVTGVQTCALPILREGLVEPAAGGRAGGALRLTDKGMALARHVVRRHRLWEMFLMYEADFAVDHVDREIGRASWRGRGEARAVGRGRAEAEKRWME